ncbi:MAG: hypothetical protein MJK04_35655 [Psychrosphaera sp.]|nr:hypothetical protein [Psychrosphaera sp.]
MGMRDKGALFALALFLSGCGGGSSTPDIPVAPAVNTPPVLVVETPTQTIDDQQDTVTLSITASDDKSVASYSWSQTAGIPVTLADATMASAHFDTPLVNYNSGDQQLEFQVIVTDSENASTSAQLAVTIKPNNYVPTANILALADVHSGNTVELKVDADDADGTIVSYHWQQLSGASVTISNADTANASFIAPQTELGETLSFEVTVTDNKQTSATASVNVNVSASLQTPPQLVTLPKVITKSGAFTLIEWEVSSEDPLITVAVEQTGQQNDLTIVVTDQNKAYFTAPEAATTALTRTLKLTATDSEGQSSEVDVELEIQPSAATIYPQSKRIYNFANQGFDIDEFDVADMNGDGISDIITREAGGSFWYKNNGNLNIDFTPNKIRGVESWYNSAYELLEDLNGDGSVDVVYYQGDDDGYALYLLPNDGSGKFTTTELIGYLPGVNSHPYSREIRVATFTTANKPGKYITVALRDGNKGHLSVFAPSPSGYTLVSTKSFNNKGPIVSSVTACDLKQNGNADLFFQLREFKAGAGDRQASLHVLSGDDNYQTDTQVDEGELFSSAFACLPSGDKQRLIQHRGGNTNITVEINYDSDQSTYSVKEFDSAMVSSTLSTNEFISLDVNGDGIDDLVALYDDRKQSQVFLRSDAIGLTFTEDRNAMCMCRVTQWAETSDYRQFYQNNNTFWVSHKLRNNGPFDDDSGSQVEFSAALKTIGKISFLGANVLVEKIDANNDKSYLALKLVDGQLTPDSAFDMSLLEHGIPMMADVNSDGKDDVLYRYRKPNGTDQSDSTHIATRLATDSGFGPEQILIVSDDNYNKLELYRTADVNGDGVLDISTSYNLEYSFEIWWLYDSQTQNYVSDIYGDLFVTDVYLGSYAFFRSFEDVDGNNLRDIFRLGELNTGCGNNPTPFCGYLQINLQRSPGQFAGWTNIEENPYSFREVKFIDIDLDGTQDLLLSGKPMIEGDDDPNGTPSQSWYQFAQDGTITKHQADTMPSDIVDLYGNGQPYLVDFDFNAKRMIPYHYSDLVKKPVPSEIQTLPISFNSRPWFVDIDQDNDTDIIYYDDDHIYLIENKVK